MFQLHLHSINIVLSMHGKNALSRDSEVSERSLGSISFHPLMKFHEGCVGPQCQPGQEGATAPHQRNVLRASTTKGLKWRIMTMASRRTASWTHGG